MTPFKIVTREYFTLKLAHIIMSGSLTSMQILVSIGSSQQMKYNRFVTFYTVLSFFSRSCSQLNRFSRFVAQMTCFCVSFGVKAMGTIFEKYAANLRKCMNRQFQDTTPIPKNRNISGTVNPIKSKFEVGGWSRITTDQIQHD